MTSLSESNSFVVGTSESGFSEDAVKICVNHFLCFVSN